MLCLNLDFHYHFLNGINSVNDTWMTPYQEIKHLMHNRKVTAKLVYFSWPAEESLRRSCLFSAWSWTLMVRYW